MESTFTVLRVRGIPIGVNWTWIFVFALIAWSLGAVLFPRAYPGLESGTYLAMAVATALLFFTSILLHELGHAFRALKEGMRIEGITLWLFGGVAKFTGMFPSAGAEFRIAIAGPLVSVALAAGFGAAAYFGAQAGIPDVIQGVVDYLAWINALLVGFNMVPALPLDGGRVLRAWLWHRQGSFSAATASAARAGRAFGMMLIAVGILGFFTGAGTGGIWFVFLGWFLLQAAQAEASFAVMRSAFKGVRVRDLMSPDPVTVSPWTRIEEFIDQAAASRYSSYPVLDHDRLSGLVSLRMASAVRPEDRGQRIVRDVMLTDEKVPVLPPDIDMLDALDALRDGPGRAVVVEDGRVAGMLSISDVARALELEQLRGPVTEPAARKSGLFVWVVVGVVMLLAAGFLFRPPLAVVEPGETLDVTADITISGAETHEVTGRYLLTAVQLSQPNALGAALALVRGDQQIIPLSAVFPQGVDPEEFVEEQRSLFRESQLLAAAAAARGVGMDVVIDGTGAHVLGVMDGTPAARVLERGDIIEAINGTPIRLSGQVRDEIQARPSGTPFTLRVRRDDIQLEVTVRSEPMETIGEGSVGIGVFIETHELDVQLPFEVDFRLRDIGGPSAGLTYALAIADMLDSQDLADGRTIAATGTVDLDGRIGRVGGVDVKAFAAHRADADVLFVPSAEVDQARGNDVRVVGVGSLADALHALRPA